VGTHAEGAAGVTRAVLRRITGAAVVGLSVLPVFRLLDREAVAPSRQVSIDVAQATLNLVAWGAASALLLGLALAIFLPTTRVRNALHSAGDRLLDVSLGTFAAVLASTSTALAIAVERMLYMGFFTNVDEMASVIQARYMAAGALVGSLPGLPEAWLIPNMLMVDIGWVSQFPPSHLLAMALAIKVGLLRYMGPLLLGAFVGLTTLVLPRVLVDNPRTARLASIAVALSPFLVSIGAGGLSHTTAGAAGMLALYTALRSRDGHAGWSILSGLSIGFMVASRPWVGLVLGGVATVGVWGPHWFRRRDEVASGWFARRALGTMAGGVPWAAFLAWYNLRLFGSPLTLGYVKAYGVRHGLGFHPDPWGYSYSLMDALGFTSTDLVTFGLQLLETPIPLVAVVGLWLLTAPHLARGSALLLAWALAPVAANVVYWFHDTRMLYESAPAWIGLAVLAAVRFSQSGWGEKLRPLPRDVALWVSVIAVVTAGVSGIPTRMLSYRWSAEKVARVSMPDFPGAESALVFVHASWNERLSSQLQGAGDMRQDTIITSIRRNSHCELQRYAAARELLVRGGDGSVVLPRIDLLQAAGTPDGMERKVGPNGTRLRLRSNEPFPAECMAELRADRFGTVALAPLLYQGDLPGIEGGKPLFVRDLGPEKNEVLRSFFPARTPYVLAPKGDGTAPEIVPYEEGMQVLWGEVPTGF
jgi:hypothetical protein